jgi:threonine aldolase
MVKVEMSEEHNINILGCKSEPLEVVGNALLLGHLWRVKEGTHWVKELGAEFRRGYFLIVTANVVEDTTIGCLD